MTVQAVSPSARELHRHVHSSSLAALVKEFFLDSSSEMDGDLLKVIEHLPDGPPRVVIDGTPVAFKYVAVDHPDLMGLGVRVSFARSGRRRSFVVYASTTPFDHWHAACALLAGRVLGNLVGSPEVMEFCDGECLDKSVLAQAFAEGYAFVLQRLQACGFLQHAHLARFREESARNHTPQNAEALLTFLVDNNLMPVPVLRASAAAFLEGILTLERAPSSEAEAAFAVRA